MYVSSKGECVETRMNTRNSYGLELINIKVAVSLLKMKCPPKVLCLTFGVHFKNRVDTFFLLPMKSVGFQMESARFQMKSSFPLKLNFDIPP